MNKTLYAVYLPEKTHWVLHDPRLGKYVSAINSVYACYRCGADASDKYSMWCEHLYSHPVFNEKFDTLSNESRNGVWEEATMALSNIDSSLSYVESEDTVLHAAREQESPTLETDGSAEEIEAGIMHWLTERPL